MNRKAGYKFTNKSHPVKAIMSAILGIISVASICLAVFLTFQQKGVAEFRYGTVAFLTTILAFVGIGLGVASKMEKDKFYLFSYIGIAFNITALAGISLILYAGAYGL